MDFFSPNLVLQPPHYPQHHFHRSKNRSPSEEAHNTYNNGGEVVSDECGENHKKRRLSSVQVKALEMSFETCDKLEPDTKLELAKTLKMQPRQIAIWFQNRRARWKNKKLEKDNEFLKTRLKDVEASNLKLLAQNQRLRAQMVAFKVGEETESINLNKETGDSSCSNRSDSCDSDNGIKLKILRTGPPVSNDSMNNLSAPANIFQLLQNSSRADNKDESLCNMFGSSMSDQPGFWPWLDQHHFN